MRGISEFIQCKGRFARSSTKYFRSGVVIEDREVFRLCTANMARRSMACRYHLGGRRLALNELKLGLHPRPSQYAPSKVLAAALLKLPCSPHRCCGQFACVSCAGSRCTGTSPSGRVATASDSAQAATQSSTDSVPFEGARSRASGSAHGHHRRAVTFKPQLAPQRYSVHQGAQCDLARRR